MKNKGKNDFSSIDLSTKCQKNLKITQLIKRKKIKFKYVKDDFQKKLKNSYNSDNSNKIGIKADKSRNLYKIDPPIYMKILHDKTTEKYKLD